MKYVKSLDMFGVDAKEIPCIKGKGVPTTATEGAVGCFYMDEDVGMIYKCIAADGGVWTWTKLGSGVFTPDDFKGTDTEKLQACFDALANVGGVITINRNLKLTDNVQIKNNSGLSLQIVVQAGGKHATIDMGEYHFCGLQGVSAGLVAFDNIHFKGTSNLVDASYLIRLRFDGCFFSGFTHIIYSERYVQSVNITNSYVRSVSGYVYHAMADGLGNEGVLYDCKFSHNVVEGSNAIMTCRTAAGCSFTDNCIEGNTKWDNDLFQVYYHLHGVEISNNYFETNNGALFDFTKCSKDAQLRVTICNNHFCEDEDGKAMIIMPINYSAGHSNILIYGNEMKTNSPSVLLKSERTDCLANVACFANYGTIVDENNTIDHMTANEFGRMIRQHKATYPYETSKRFTFMGVAVISVVDKTKATVVVNTPYDLTKCDITTVQIWTVAGLTPTTVNVGSKETHSFTINITLPSEVTDRPVTTVSGAYYLTIH